MLVLMFNLVELILYDYVSLRFLYFCYEVECVILLLDDYECADVT